MGRRAALEEAIALGATAKPLVPLIAEQLRHGLRATGSEIVALLHNLPRPELYDAALDAGILRSLNVYERSRLMQVGIGDHESDLCTYVYRNWQDMADPMVSYAIEAFERAGTTEAKETLTAILPDLAELANVSGLHASEPSAETQSPSKLLESIEARTAAQRLTMARSATHPQALTRPTETASRRPAVLLVLAVSFLVGVGGERGRVLRPRLLLLRGFQSRRISPAPTN